MFSRPAGLGIGGIRGSRRRRAHALSVAGYAHRAVRWCVHGRGARTGARREFAGVSQTGWWSGDIRSRTGSPAGDHTGIANTLAL